MPGESFNRYETSEIMREIIKESRETGSLAVENLVIHPGDAGLIAEELWNNRVTELYFVNCAFQEESFEIVMKGLMDNRSGGKNPIETIDIDINCRQSNLDKGDIELFIETLDMVKTLTHVGYKFREIDENLEEELGILEEAAEEAELRGQTWRNQQSQKKLSPDEVGEDKKGLPHEPPIIVPDSLDLSAVPELSPEDFKADSIEKGASPQSKGWPPKQKLAEHDSRKPIHPENVIPKEDQKTIGDVRRKWKEMEEKKSTNDIQKPEDPLREDNRKKMEEKWKGVVDASKKGSKGPSQGF